MAPMLGDDVGFRTFYPLDRMTAEYSFYYPELPSSNALHYLGYHPTADNGFVAAAHDLFVPPSEPPDAVTEFRREFYEPFSAYQELLVPPAARESAVVTNSAYCYHQCRWLSGSPCDGLAPGKNREMGEHLRVFHHFVGHERDTVRCEWGNCGQVMQRMNVPRHIVSRHLLAAASCRFCARQFSRPDVVSRHERTCSGGVFPV